MNNLSSSDMAVKAIIWLKRNKRCYVHCTEFGNNWRADAIGTDGKLVYEIEIKTSWADFQADFKNKEKKHSTYMKEDSKAYGYMAYKANYLWYLVPEYLVKNTTRFLIENEQYSKYGILTFNKNNEIISAKSVKQLHKEIISPKIEKQMIARMSNEYIYLLESVKGKLINKVTDCLDKLLHDASDSYKQLVEGENEQIIR